MKSKKGIVGWFLFGLSLLVFMVFMMVYYLPAMESDITNIKAINIAMVVGLVCGIFGTIGLMIEKHK
jgi:uncharacterized membrane protein YjfL (UPF0719 family)